MRVVMGIEDAGDDAGRRHPWHIVVLAGARRHAFLAAIPSAPRYLSAPRHPLYGDLTALPTSLAQATEELMERLAADGVETVHMSSVHEGGTIARALGWNAMGVQYHDVAYDDVLRDPHSIGGYAGHEIAVMADAIRGNA